MEKPSSLFAISLFASHRNRPSSDVPGRGGPGSSRSDAAHERTERKRKQNADRRVVNSLHLPAQRAPCGARSPVGVPLRLSPGGLLVPKAQHQAMLPGTVRSVRSDTAAPTGERRPCASPRALPAPKQSRCSEHLTCRSLCRQDDARAARVRERRNPRPRAPQPRSRQPSSIGWCPFTKSETERFYSLSQELSSYVAINETTH